VTVENPRVVEEGEVTKFAYVVMLGNMCWHDSVSHLMRVVTTPVLNAKIRNRLCFKTSFSHLITVCHNDFLWDSMFDHDLRYMTKKVNIEKARKQFVSWKHYHGVGMFYLQEHQQYVENEKSKNWSAWNPFYNGQLG
jgi:hypothetical protein